jgi:hypothetical protein
MREIRLTIAPSEVTALDRVVSSAIAAYNEDVRGRHARKRRTLIEARDLVVELRLAIARADAAPTSR